MQKKRQVQTAKGRPVSSTHWLYRHINDPYVSMAKEKGYRSRAAFKLTEIDDKFKIMPKNGVIIDLGCAPGSWLQVLSRRSKCMVVGVDLKEVSCDDIDRSIAITGDFTDEITQSILKDKITSNQITLVVSDMAPNSCGDKKTDHIRIAYLAEQVLDFINENCHSGANAVMKIIQGNMSDKFFARAKNLFQKVIWYKPKASYSDSAEIYLVMLNLLDL